jgi:hypothetical protein
MPHLARHLWQTSTKACRGKVESSGSRRVSDVVILSQFAAIPFKGNCLASRPPAKAALPGRNFLFPPDISHKRYFPAPRICYIVRFGTHAAFLWKDTQRSRPPRNPGQRRTSPTHRRLFCSRSVQACPHRSRSPFCRSHPSRGHLINRGQRPHRTNARARWSHSSGSRLNRCHRTRRIAPRARRSYSRSHPPADCRFGLFLLGSPRAPGRIARSGLAVRRKGTARTLGGPRPCQTLKVSMSPP